VVAAPLATGLAALTLAAASPSAPTPPPRPTPVLTGTERMVPYTRRSSLLAIAQQYSASPHTLRRINNFDTRGRQARPRRILVSTRAISPRPFPDGVVINLPAFRLFQLRKGEVVGSWPVALGRDFDRAWHNQTRWRTPIGTFRIRAKEWHPDWIVPKDLQKELKVPRERVPFGDPEYPLGEAKLVLTAQAINIHGTNSPRSIGRLASHGCIRMWNKAITDLYRQVRVGTPVALVYAPVQVVEQDGRVWLEVNRDVYGLAGDLHDRARTVIQGAGLAGRVDPYLVAKTVTGAPGIAVDVTATVTIAPTPRPSPPAPRPAAPVSEPATSPGRPATGSVQFRESPAP